jgi:AcrR family transcriptional regulator
VTEVKDGAQMSPTPPTSALDGAGAAPNPPPNPPARTAKSEQTRTLILDTALRLFSERGYDRTTMRAIAAEAGVSVGNAYYYFASKEHLIQGYYHRMMQLHVDAAARVLDTETDFAARLHGVLDAWVEVARPYHEFAGQFFRNAADPRSPLSPFSAESAPARQVSTDLYRQALAGSDLRVDPELREELPGLLWMFQMGVVLFWVYDESEAQVRTRELVARTVPLLARLLAATRYRLLRPLVRDVAGLARDFTPGHTHPAS